MIWDLNEYSWNENYNLVKEYILLNNVIPVYSTVYKDKRIGLWLHTQVNAYLCNNTCNLDCKKIVKLKALGLDMNMENYYWNKTYKAVYDFYKNRINEIDYDFANNWFNSELEKYNNGNLDKSQKKKMKSLIKYINKVIK
ncbi:MAG: helicase associated domain-containing protein [Bacilli bacterium]|nr:helicase associated domain-containing protein [Bacilli bacterium]